MGGGTSHFEPNPDVVGQSRYVLVFALELGYSIPDVDDMYRKFSLLDYSRTGVVKIAEYVDALNVPNSLFAALMLSAFDDKHSGVMTFEEFLVCCWNVLTMSETNFAKFVFQLFDTEKFGDLTVMEITELISILCGPDSASVKHLEKELLVCNVTRADDMTFDQFFTLVKQTPLLMYPAYQVRDKLRSNTLGAKRWILIGQNKAKLYGEHTMTDIIGSMVAKPSCYTQKTLSYFHTGLMVRSPEAERLREKSMARRGKERRNKRKIKSSGDLRNDGSGLTAGSSDSNASDRRGMSSSSKSRSNTMRRNSMGGLASRTNSFNLEIGTTNNSTRHNTTRIKNSLPLTPNPKSNQDANSTNSPSPNPHNNQTDGNNTSTTNSPHKQAPRRKSLGSTGGKIMGGVFASDEMNQSFRKSPARLSGTECSRQIIIKRTESRTILI